MELSPRLSAVAAAVVAGHPFADIGTDHAALPLHCVQAGRVPRAIAIDVGAGPLGRARERIVAAGSPAVELRTGSGLEPLAPGEVATVVLAGMGGGLIRRLVDACPEVVSTLERLVLQPNTQWREIRAWIRDHAWRLDHEQIVEDAGRFYVVFTVTPHRGPAVTWDERDLVLGPLLRRHPDPIFTRWARERHAELRRALAELTARGAPDDPRHAELRHRLSVFAEV